MLAGATRAVAPSWKGLMGMLLSRRRRVGTGCGPSMGCLRAAAKLLVGRGRADDPHLSWLQASWQAVHGCPWRFLFAISPEIKTGLAVVSSFAPCMRALLLEKR